MSFPFTVPLTQREITTPTSTQRCPLGTRGAMADGRIFHYCKNGGVALSKGYLVSSETGTTQWEVSTAGFWSTDHSAGTAFNGATSIAAGTTFVNLSATQDSDLYVATDFFKEGWLWVSGTSTQSGQMMKIKTHNVASSGSTGYCSTGGQLYVVFEDGYSLLEAVDTADEVSMMKNEYDDVVVTPATYTQHSVGVPLVTVPANNYFWAQTWGICPMRSEGEAIISGKPVFNSTQTAGTIQGATASTDLTGTGQVITGQWLGSVVSASGLAVLEANCHVMVHLTISP